MLVVVCLSDTSCCFHFTCVPRSWRPLASWTLMNTTSSCVEALWVHGSQRLVSCVEALWVHGSQRLISCVEALWVHGLAAWRHCEYTALNVLLAALLFKHFTNTRTLHDCWTEAVASSDCFYMPCIVFTVLHVMQTRYCEEISVCLSVCLSVRPSVRHTRDPWQNGRKICPHFYTIRKNIYPSFLRRRMVVPNRRNSRDFKGNRGRGTRRWRQILDRKWKYGRFAHAQWKIRNITLIYDWIAEIYSTLEEIGVEEHAGDVRF